MELGNYAHRCWICDRQRGEFLQGPQLELVQKQKASCAGEQRPCIAKARVRKNAREQKVDGPLDACGCSFRSGFAGSCHLEVKGWTARSA